MKIAAGATTTTFEPVTKVASYAGFGDDPLGRRGPQLTSVTAD